MTPKAAAIRPRDRDTIVSDLRAGVVPPIGLHHIQVGRQLEKNRVLQAAIPVSPC
jgi:hypothetical protein